MSKLSYVYPVVFAWDRIIPSEYPFIHITGPDGSMGCLLVFDSLETFQKYSNGDGKLPLIISEVERGEQNGRNGQGESANSLQGGRRGSKTSTGGNEADGVAGRKRKHQAEYLGDKRDRQDRR